MSILLVSRSPDLQRLRDEGYDLSIRGGQLVVSQVPYVKADRTVGYCILVSELTTQGNATAAPESHQMWFIGENLGEVPCDANGAALENIISDRNQADRGYGLVVSCAFSTKPPSGSYKDYYDKARKHIQILEHQAQAIDPKVTARVLAPVTPDEDESVFEYLDSASSRAGIGAVSQRLASLRVAIVGAGGTGAYILDLVSKTHVREIHIFDDDVFQTHNAFRAPGAATREELDVAPRKVDYFKARYEKMHRGIIAHSSPVDESNIDDLRDFDFIFLAMDGGPVKKYVLESIEGFGIPFIDVGMGVQQKDTSLRGQVRTTTSTPEMRRHIWERHRIDFADQPEDIYEQNIQIADLNMLNAALAVIRWKKLFGFYLDLDQEHSSTYMIDGNFLVNEDRPE
jgi:hypothetical protein